MEQKNAPRPRCHFRRTNKISTIKHIMIKCQYFNVIRSNYYNVHNMKDLFEKVTVDKIINFLKETSLYQYI